LIFCQISLSHILWFTIYEQEQHVDNTGYRRMAALYFYKAHQLFFFEESGFTEMNRKCYCRLNRTEILCDWETYNR
jgi:hypothetical protein